MYEKIKNLSIPQQIEAITRELISIESINGTVGETAVADFIKQILLSFPYFQLHTNSVWEQPIPNDPAGRKNIFALLKGSSSSKNTIIYHAHMDTVGTEDYGSLQKDALNSDALETFFKDYHFDQEVEEDARSGDWLFGRGSLDMQSGIAVHLVNLLYYTEHVEELGGNILFMSNPDEESQHKGIISAISVLNELKRTEGLTFVSAINTDFITPQYDSDPHRYIYTGSAGKLLPSFYIYGREAHVGDTLSGIDSTHISSEINRRINNNINLSENIEGELVLPPSCLYQKDTKQAYNVQTAKSSYLYFNYFIYEATAREVMRKLERLTLEACLEVEETLAAHYEEFTRRTGLPSRNLSWHVEVTSLEDYIEELEALGVEVEEVSKRVIEENAHLESRMLSFKIVEALQQLDPDKKPRVIIFYAPPYLPHNYLQEDSKRDQLLLEIVQENLDSTSVKTGEVFTVKKFFPYLADGSFLSLHETDEEIDTLVKNFPELSRLYPIPIKEIRHLNVPSINMGVYGKDGHKWTERVYKPYSFDILPALIRDTSQMMLNKFNELQLMNVID
ncbi:M20/M25/M40 family metallo-hydrolase [Guptibacillus hwajinpoensis]|uniref:M20/M25/M40 family metallo-hydrolase n=1 Tax=Guptibacillus hwajinpoensis TaxID=208199 RepID=UPI001CFC864D|nr:M20/M25/M40 family metallo-hydrolase [Pseudalkalibacillus hwajinpoensis]WLR58958.1 peptidase M20 [Pseudalkalibacillus hwajinpoensis]